MRVRPRFVALQGALFAVLVAGPLAYVTAGKSVTVDVDGASHGARTYASTVRRRAVAAGRHGRRARHCRTVVVRAGDERHAGRGAAWTSRPPRRRRSGLGRVDDGRRRAAPRGLPRRALRRRVPVGVAVVGHRVVGDGARRAHAQDRVGRVRRPSDRVRHHRGDLEPGAGRCRAAAGVHGRAVRRARVGTARRAAGGRRPHRHQDRHQGRRDPLRDHHHDLGVDGRRDQQGGLARPSGPVPRGLALHAARRRGLLGRAGLPAPRRLPAGAGGRAGDPAPGTATHLRLPGHGRGRPELGAPSRSASPAATPARSAATGPTSACTSSRSAPGTASAAPATRSTPRRPSRRTARSCSTCARGAGAWPYCGRYL